MAEATRISVGVVTACADADALDALVVPGRATACRVAEDEMLLVCGLEVAEEVTREVGTRVTVLDPDAVVLDSTDGWTAVRIDGADADVVFASLSRLPAPERGFAQGDVARVPAKILVDGGGIVVLAPAAVGDHLRTRVARAVQEAS